MFGDNFWWRLFKHAVENFSSQAFFHNAHNVVKRYFFLFVVTDAIRTEISSESIKKLKSPGHVPYLPWVQSGRGWRRYCSWRRSWTRDLGRPPALAPHVSVLQGDQLYMAVLFWHLIKSDLSIVQMYRNVYTKSHFLQGTRKTRSGRVVQQTLRKI